MGHGYSDPPPQFGSLVRWHRRKAGLTQRELAALSGLSVGAVRDFEQSRRHRPRASSLAALADALGLDSKQIAALGNAARLSQRSTDAASSVPSPQDDPGFTRTPRLPCRDVGLWLSALGPLEARWDGRPLRLGPPARRTVLALLLVSPGAVVRQDMIIDALWGDSPPRTAVGLVHAHVSRIRKLLNSDSRPGASGAAISSVRGVYQLTALDQEVDLLVFRNLVEHAAAARAGGDDVAAVECYEDAMSLWRDNPLADIDVLSGHPSITALKQELTDVLLRYADAACALGLHDRVLPRLRALANADQLNERAHARLMIALASSGLQAAAIGVYETMRVRLDDELGLYPGEELAEAFGRVLRGDTRTEARHRPHRRLSWGGAFTSDAALPGLS